MMRSAGRYMYSISLALWVGGISVFTFLVTPRLFGSFDRDEASRIVNVLFEVYFDYVLAVTLASLVIFMFTRQGMQDRMRKISLGLLAAALLISIYTNFGLYPHIMEVKGRIISFVTEPEDSLARREFKRLHAISAILNLLVLADGATLIYLNSKDSG